MNFEQKYTIDYLCTIKGMMNEIKARLTRCNLELDTKPENIKSINRDIGALEGEMDAILLSLDFIDNFPSKHLLGFEPISSTLARLHATNTP